MHGDPLWVSNVLTPTTSNFPFQLKIKKKKMASDQEQLASKLDKALSLTKQTSGSRLFKFSDGSGEIKSERGCGT